MKVLQTLIAALRQTFERHRAWQQGLVLRTMSEQELADLGIGRGEIPFLLKQR